MGRQPGHIHAFELYGSPRWSHDAVEHIEERRFARAVGTDQRMHGVAADRQIDLVDRLEATEVLGEAVNEEYGGAVLAGSFTRERKRRDDAGNDGTFGAQLAPPRH